MNSIRIGTLINALDRSEIYNWHSLEIEAIEISKSEVSGGWRIFLHTHGNKTVAYVGIDELDCIGRSREIADKLGWFVGGVLPGADLNDPVFKVTEPDSAKYSGFMRQEIVSYDPITNSYKRKECETMKAIRTPDGVTILLNNCSHVWINEPNQDSDNHTLRIMSNSGVKFDLFAGSLSECESVENRILSLIGADVIPISDIETYGTTQYAESLQQLKDRIAALENGRENEVKVRKEFADQIAELANQLVDENL